MSELRIMLLLVAGPALWMLGGYHWKGGRRFVWPGIAAVVTGGWLTGLGLVAVNCLPYGDRTPMWRRLLTFAALGLPAVFLDWQAGLVGSLVCGLLLPALFVATRKRNAITWKIWEGAAGFLQAAGLVVAALR